VCLCACGGGCTHINHRGGGTHARAGSAASSMRPHLEGIDAWRTAGPTTTHTHTHIHTRAHAGSVASSMRSLLEGVHSWRTAGTSHASGRTTGDDAAHAHVTAIAAAVMAQRSADPFGPGGELEGLAAACHAVPRAPAGAALHMAVASGRTSTTLSPAASSVRSH
jgi:hypothetical protein